MEKIKLWNTDLLISPVALGTDFLGLTLNEEESYFILDAFLERGGNLLDTALVYSDWEPGEKCRSEKLIGRWLKERKNRDKVIISTKGAHPPIGHMDIPRLSREEILSDMDKSLMNLGCDYVDIYWLHRDAEHLPVDEIMDTLGELVKAGKTRYIGMSNWTHKRIEEANCYAERNSIPKIFSSQIQYSVADSIKENNDPTLVLMNDSEYNYFKEKKMPVFAYSAQAKGLFSKIDALGKDGVTGKAAIRYLSKRNLKRFEVIKDLSLKYSVTVAEIVISALCSNPDFQVIPIVGCKNLSHLENTLSGTKIKLTSKEYFDIVNI